MKNSTEKKFVMVVEDEEFIREAMVHALEIEDYKVVAAENGGVALDHLLKGLRPNVILLDLTMPVLTGREFLAEVALRPEWAEIPVIVVSAIADDRNTAGSTAFIRKPFDLDVLLTMVEKYSGRLS